MNFKLIPLRSEFKIILQDLDFNNFDEFHKIYLKRL